MSDIDLAVTCCKRLESLLEKNLGATGKGLHEKVSSVESKLPHELVRKLRLVATVRNKVVHEASYRKIEDRRAFIEAGKTAERELRAIGGVSGSKARVILIAVLIGLLSLLAILYRHVIRG